MNVRDGDDRNDDDGNDGDKDDWKEMTEIKVF
jgi:hypothetical protein